MTSFDYDEMARRPDLTMEEKVEILMAAPVSELFKGAEIVHYEGPRPEVPMEVKSVRMSIETYDELAKLAEAQGVKPTALIRLAVEEYVARAHRKIVDIAEARKALEVLSRVVEDTERRAA